MAKKRIGIDALFQSSIPVAVPATVLERVEPHSMPTNLLSPNPSQPRAFFDDHRMGELAASIRDHGILQPILVRQTPDSDRYQIVAGERRWRAAILVGLAEVPVRVVELSDGEALAVAMVENLQRENLNPIEEAEGYLDLLTSRLSNEPVLAEFADGLDVSTAVIRILRSLTNQKAGNTKNNVVLSLEPIIADVFGRVGKITWQSFVSHRLPLLNLPEEIRSAIRTGQLPHTKARAIARITDQTFGGNSDAARRVRKDLIDQATAEGCSVRELQAIVNRLIEQAKLDQVGESRSSLRASRLVSLRGKLDDLQQRLAAVDPDDFDDDDLEAMDAALDKLLKTM